MIVTKQPQRSADIEAIARRDRQRLNPIPLAEFPAGIIAALLYDDAEAFACERGWKLYELTALEGIGGCAALLGHHVEGARLLEDLLMGRATAKTHLSHVFTKLGVASRAELASRR